VLLHHGQVVELRQSQPPLPLQSSEPRRQHKRRAPRATRCRGPPLAFLLACQRLGRGL
jgi:hypothetical protein